MTIQSKSEILNARFEGDDLEKVMEFCFKNDITRSELVRTAVHMFMKCYPHRDKIKTMISWLKDTPEKTECL